MYNGSNVTVANYTTLECMPTNSSDTTKLCTLTGLSDDTSYNFFMQAFNSAGVGPNTTVYTVRTDAGK